MDSFLLDQSPVIDEILSAYGVLKTPGFLIWATDFEEERATEGQILGLKNLVAGLSNRGTRGVVNMFGGYFSCLLADHGMTGISHGLGYGERRDITPVLGGGLPPAKYYLPAIHQHIRIDQFASIAGQLSATEFAQTICNCVICSGLLRQGKDHLIQQFTATQTKLVSGRYRQSATSQVYRLTRFHYMHNKHREFGRCNENGCSNLLNELDAAYTRFRPDLGTSSLMYLRTWKRALSTP